MVDQYRPTIIRNEEAGFVEFVTEDVPTITGHVEARNVEPIVRLAGPRGEVLGYRIYDAHPNPTPGGVTVPEGIARETGWLCEWNHATGPEWWTLGGEDGGYFAKDSLKALRFAREVDAQAFIDAAGWTEIVPTEHEWSDRALAASPSVNEGRT